MKTSFFLILGTLFLPLNLVSCSGNNTNEEEINAGMDEKAILEMGDISRVATFSYDSAALSEDEIAGLYLMREEEKMARDVYAFFYAKFNVRTFGNITKSENQHASAVLRLINNYGLTDPAKPAPGEFTNQELQELYNKFTTEAITAVDALKVGALIEETDINDLMKLIAKTKNTNIQFVYSNLLRGSIFHLKAFTSVLKVRGVTYVPTVLSQEQYNAIIGK
ncbi:MAG: hypothetical protein H6Q19_232 [Bacteroidetes bacterium]|nr:hypothetical protein [Bacteroidota bacterium]